MLIALSLAAIAVLLASTLLALLVAVIAWILRVLFAAVYVTRRLVPAVKRPNVADVSEWE